MQYPEWLPQEIKDYAESFFPRPGAANKSAYKGSARTIKVLDKRLTILIIDPGMGKIWITLNK